MYTARVAQPSWPCREGEGREGVPLSWWGGEGRRERGGVRRVHDPLSWWGGEGRRERGGVRRVHDPGYHLSPPFPGGQTENITFPIFRMRAVMRNKLANKAY